MGAWARGLQVSRANYYTINTLHAPEVRDEHGRSPQTAAPHCLCFPIRPSVSAPHRASMLPLSLPSVLLGIVRIKPKYSSKEFFQMCLSRWNPTLAGNQRHQRSLPSPGGIRGRPFSPLRKSN